MLVQLWYENYPHWNGLVCLSWKVHCYMEYKYTDVNETKMVFNKNPNRFYQVQWCVLKPKAVVYKGAWDESFYVESDEMFKRMDGIL